MDDAIDEEESFIIAAEDSSVIDSDEVIMALDEDMLPSVSVLEDVQPAINTLNATAARAGLRISDRERCERDMRKSEKINDARSMHDD